MEINPKTLFFGVLGNPVSHSKSPKLFNGLFRDNHINGVYRYIETVDVQKALEGIRHLGYRGASVTLPHKESAFCHVDEVDELSKEAGCINTVVNDGGVLKGYNTDGLGACVALSRRDENWNRRKILFLGMGGAARGIAMTFLLEYGVKEFLFLTQNLEKQEQSGSLRRRLEERGATVGVYSYDRAGEIFGEGVGLVVNATSLGMAPREGQTPLPKQYFRSGQLVFDVVYTPKDTRFLREAGEAGCTLVYGYEMFLAQAVLQYELWFGVKKDISKAEGILNE